MKLSQIQSYKKILIAGYGVEGKSTELFLRKHAPHVNIVLADDISHPEGLKKQSSCDIAIKSPGFPKDSLTIPYTTATNIFLDNIDAKTIGITGTKGKSSTCLLLHEVLKESGKKSHLLGNIGKPMLDEFDKIKKDHFVVLELSSYQTEDLTVSPNISVILNLYPEKHNHASLKAYYKAKMNIVSHAKHSDYYIYNPEFDDLILLANQTAARPIPCVPSAAVSHFDFSKVHKHTLQSVLTVLHILNIDVKHLQRALEGFKGLPHRQTLLGTFRGITFVDDSGANHPEATVHALASIKAVETLILGGQDRGYDFKPVIDSSAAKKVKNIILLPETDKKIQSLIKKHLWNPQIYIAQSMEEAVSYAFENTSKDMVCLLSPGAPSYLMYKNFNERGDDFTKLVKKYAKTIQAKAN